MHKTKFLLANRIRTPDGTVLQSFSTHHFASHVDSVTGETYFTDGGLSYIRRSVNTVAAQDMTVYSGHKHDEVRKAFHWGTYGPNGTEEKKYVPLKDLTTEHINVILRSQQHVKGILREVFLDELEYRFDNQNWKD